MAKKRNPQDITLRNLRALHKKIDKLYTLVKQIRKTQATVNRK